MMNFRICLLSLTLALLASGPVAANIPQTAQEATGQNPPDTAQQATGQTPAKSAQEAQKKVVVPNGGGNSYDNLEQRIEQQQTPANPSGPLQSGPVLPPAPSSDDSVNSDNSTVLQPNPLPPVDQNSGSGVSNAQDAEQRIYNRNEEQIRNFQKRNLQGK